VGRALAVLRNDPVTRAVFAIGVVEIIAWGTTFYALGGLGQIIAASTGWGRSLVFGGMTVGLLSAAATSARIGRMVDEHGGRLTMGLGALLAAAGLAGAALSPTPWTYLACWVVIGVAMRLTLYDAAFAALVQIDPARGRRAISYLTLFGGLASTVFWPIGHTLGTAWGWREALLVFAAVNLFMALPLVLVGLPRRAKPAHTEAAPVAASGASGADDALLPPAARRAAMVMFTAVIAANSYVFGSLSAHLITVLQGVGVATGTAVTLAAIKGVAQVAGRLGEILFGQALPALGLARIAIGLLPLAFAFLLLGGANLASALAFTLLFGVSNGLVTIVRGAVPLALFGSEGYGALLGLLAAPQLIVIALSPTVFVALTDWLGPQAGLISLLVAAFVSTVSIEVMTHWARRQAKSRS
jgi:hypothetical protein